MSQLRRDGESSIVYANRYSLHLIVLEQSVQHRADFPGFSSVLTGRELDFSGNAAEQVLDRGVILSLCRTILRQYSIVLTLPIMTRNKVFVIIRQKRVVLPWCRMIRTYRSITQRSEK